MKKNKQKEVPIVPLRSLRIRGNLLMLLLGSFCFPTNSYAAYDSQFFAAIEQVVNRYKRPLTILEICGGRPHYLFELCSSRPAIGVALMIADEKNEVSDLVHDVQKICPHRMTVLSPTMLPCSSLEKLGKCEHFDVVLVHDISSKIQGPIQRVIAALCTLGDYVFLEVHSGEYRQILSQSKKMCELVSQEGHRGSLVFSARKKRTLTRARFTQADSSRRAPYEVLSTFTTKQFYKQGLEHPLQWIHGINLVTFAMLGGIYPSDEALRKQLSSLYTRHSDHNDLVLGNMLLSGDRLIPIDMQDSRRNASASECIDYALKAFKQGNDRLKHPQKWIDRYYARCLRNG